MAILLGRERFQPGEPLNCGGSGEFFPHPTKKDVGFKRYRDPNECDPRRLEWLCSNPPSLLQEKGVPTYTWPIAVAYDDLTGKAVGFSMRRVRHSVPLQAVVNPSDRSSAITLRWLWKVAISVLKRIHTLHLMSPSYIVGDVNVQNFYVNRQGIVSLLDIDSLHFSLPDGHVFTCDRWRAELQPPELVSVTGRVLERHQHQDAWSAFVLVHRLIRDGVGPHDAHYVGGGTPLRLTERIEQGIWPDSLRHPEYRPKTGTVPFSTLPKDIQDLFRQMFLDGANTPSLRPTVTDLLTALKLHRPAGARRSYIGPLAWKKTLEPQEPSSHHHPARGLAGVLMKPNRKVVVASAAAAAIALVVHSRSGTDVERTAPNLELLFPNRSALNEKLLERSHEHRFRRSHSELLATPELWRQAQVSPP